MKKTLFFLLIIFSISACSQDYKIESNFTIDKVYHFTVKRAKIDSREPMSKDLATLTQIEATFTQFDSLLKCNWKYGDTKTTGPENIISQLGPEYNNMLNLYKGIEIEILFDPNRGGIELLNFKKMQDNIGNSFINLYNDPLTKMDSGAMALVIEQLIPTYSTPEMLLSSYFPEIQVYFSMYGQTYSRRSINKSEFTYPNPFGGESFPVVYESKIDSKKKNFMAIKTVQQTNNDDVNRIIKETIEKLSKLGDSPISKDEMPNFTLNGESYCFYRIKNKIIELTTSEKRIVVAGITQTEILEVDLIQ